VQPEQQSAARSAARFAWLDMAAALYHSHSIVAGGFDEMS
jgi:hypothetical protein